MPRAQHQRAICLRVGATGIVTWRFHLRAYVWPGLPLPTAVQSNQARGSMALRHATLSITLFHLGGRAH